MLQKNEDIEKLYDANIRDWIKEGVLKTAEEAEPGRINYLCHFPVVRMDKSTTRVRTVVDAAARFDGVAINDFISPGPNLSNDIRRVLLRFRRKKIALAMDVKSMFTRIKLLSTEKSYNRLLWFDGHGQLKEFQFERFSFGLTCSPAVAIATSCFLVNVAEDSCELAKEAILRSTIVDDTVDSVNSCEEAKAMYEGVAQIYSLGGMNVHKLISNSNEFLSLCSERELHPKIDLSRTDPETSVKILGILWKPNKDELEFQIAFEDTKVLTRRHMATVIARVFDPIGLVSPVLVDLKHQLQQTWNLQVSWDDALSDACFERWKRSTRESVGRISFRRCLEVQEASSRELHIFCDASERALGAVAYLVEKKASQEEKTAYIVASRGKVAPLRYASIPRLELQAAVEGAELADHLLDALKLEPKELFLWTDSLDVLYWISSASRSLKVFVANRVGFIQSRTWIDHWRWVPTSLNPADILSRGCSTESLKTSSLWEFGPEFLVGRIPYPEQKTKKLTELGRREVRMKIKKLIARESNNEYWTEKLKKFSSWERFIKSICVIIRRIRKEKTTTADLYEEVKMKMMSLLQREQFNEQYDKEKPKTTFSGFKVFIHPDQQTLHAYGRISEAEHLEWKTRFPMIVLGQSHWVTVIVRDIHQNRLCHDGGPRALIAAVNEEYFILKLQQLCKSVVRSCMICRKTSFATLNPSFAPLPKFRLPTEKRTAVFSCTGMDCFGPFEIFDRKRKLKAYVLICTCTFYRAVHVEYLENLSTEEFLLAFERFIATRGRPLEVVTDNGQNFVGANNVLRRTFFSLEEELRTQYPLIRWHFNSPGTPHKGGVFERMIGLLRTSLAKSLRGRKIERNVFLTVLKQAEAGLNNRPLQAPLGELEDDVLTPNHFLRGERFCPSLPDPKDANLYEQWRMSQKILEKFWRRYISQIIASYKYSTKKRFRDVEVHPGMIVLIKEDSKKDINFPTYPMGRIDEVFVGSDGVVRSVKISVSGKKLIRGVTSIAPLFV